MSSSVVPKGELKKRLKVNKIFNDLKEEVKDFSAQELIDMRLNPALIVWVCNKVENKISKKYKANKKEVVISIVFKLIPSLNDADKRQISDIIEHLHSNDDIQKCSKFFRYVGYFFLKSLKQKLIG